MKEIKKKKDWEEFVNNYKDYIIDYDAKWNNTLDELKIWIKENNKKPSSTSKDDTERNLGCWICTQRENYKEGNKSMRNNDKKILWEEFISEHKEYFVDNDTKWNNMLNDVKEWIDKNKKKPSATSKNKIEKDFGNWICVQQTQYNTKLYHMKKGDRGILWEKFLSEYKDYFLDPDAKWFNQFEKLKKWIDDNNKRPVNTSKNIDESQLGNWLDHQISNFKNNRSGINIENKNTWKDFTEKYNNFIAEKDIKWYNYLDTVKLWIDDNNRKPYKRSKDIIEKKMGQWLEAQRANYIKNIGPIKDIDKRNAWIQFMKEYKDYFQLSKYSYDSGIIVEKKEPYKIKKDISDSGDESDDSIVIKNDKNKSKRKD